jgi:hypothetical protein
MPCLRLNHAAGGLPAERGFGVEGLHRCKEGREAHALLAWG